MERILPEVDADFDGIPKVGTGVTIPVGSDSYPATVIWVSDRLVDAQMKNDIGMVFVVRVPKSIRVSGCKYRGVEGHCNAFTESQRYVYYSDIEDESTDHQKLVLERNGREYSYRPGRGYIPVGERARGNQRIYLGARRAYRDPSF
jgi:hypothetical protein